MRRYLHRGHHCLGQWSGLRQDKPAAAAVGYVARVRRAWNRERGKGEGRPVMGRIGVEPTGDITPRENPAELRQVAYCEIVFNFLRRERRMMARAVCASTPSDRQWAGTALIGSRVTERLSWRWVWEGGGRGDG